MTSSNNTDTDRVSALTSPSTIPASVLKSDVAHLRAELERVQRENDRLMKENRSLRREATLVRLYRAIGERRAAEARRTGGGESAPAAAADLYYRLPVSFTFADFFRHAAAANLDTQTARSCLLHYLDDRLLLQVGSRLRKTDVVLRHTRE
ncbi:hypothetical protein [Longibacter sp.]|jgi:hypothetical protein|uniref:hypothetical protein n=1 Tax=Longibacter sp. TaxID=2045415 RepID=UPI003EC01171